MPEQTITRVLNPPSTDTATSSYTVAGVDPTNDSTGLITKAQLVSGSWFSAKPADEVLVNNAYASTKKLKVGSTVTINGTSYKIVGLVSPTLTGNVADIYFPLATVQTLASAPKYVNEVLVAVDKSSNVAAVTKAIKADLPGATVLTSKSLADQVTGSLGNAHKLAKDLGGALAIVVLLAAFLIAGLLTLSNVAKRVREIGSLRAIGWTRGEVVRQIMAETLGIGIIGGVLGDRDRDRDLRGRDRRSGPGSRSPRPDWRSGASSLGDARRPGDDHGHGYDDRAPHRAGERHHDRDRLRLCCRRWVDRRHARRLAGGATRTCVGAAGPRLMPPHASPTKREDTKL